MFRRKKLKFPSLNTRGVVLRHEVKHDGQKRSFYVYLPPTAPVKDYPVLMSLHGGGGDAKTHIDHSSAIAACDTMGFMGIFPNGWHPLFSNSVLTWNAGPGKCGPAAKHNIDDVGFLCTIIDLLKDLYPFDRRRVFCCGHSNGGMMAYRLAASPDGSKRFAAFCAIGGCALMDDSLMHPCRPVPIIHIHSVDDPRALYYGGEGPPFPMTKSRVNHSSVPEVIAQWAAFNGCSYPPFVYPTESMQQPDGTTHTVTREVYSNGRNGSQIVLVRLTGAGHGWPGRTDYGKVTVKLLGAPTQVIDPYREMWAMFNAHPMPASQPV